MHESSQNLDQETTAHLLETELQALLAKHGLTRLDTRMSIRIHDSRMRLELKARAYFSPPGRESERGTSRAIPAGVSGLKREAYVVYRHPWDYPSKYVVRRLRAAGDLDAEDPMPCLVADTLGDAHSWLAAKPGLRIGRRGNHDDGVITEVWRYDNFDADADRGPPVRVLICGSRSWSDLAVMRGALELLPRGSTLVYGDAPGFVKWVPEICGEFGFTSDEHLLDRTPQRGIGCSAAAVYFRSQELNRRMFELGRPDLVITFVQGSSSQKRANYLIAQAEVIDVMQIFDGVLLHKEWPERERLFDALACRVPIESVTPPRAPL